MRKILLLSFLFLINLISFSQTLPDSLTTRLLKPVKIDSIEIRGNKTTEDFIILRELTFGVGDTVDNEKLHFNKERIFSLTLFNRVELFVENHEEKNILIIDVTESWYLYPIPFWYTQNNSIKKLTYGIDFLLKNFRGRNETLHATVGLGYDKYFTVKYENPALLYDEDIGFSVYAGYTNFNNRNETAERLNKGNFSYRVIHGSIGVWKRINQFNLIGGSLSFNYWEAKTKPIGAITASGKLIDHLPGAGVYHFYDSRDLKLYSQDGFYSLVNYLHRGFGVDNINYSILEIDLRGYQTLAGELSSKLRLFHKRTFGREVPFYDYEYLGYSEKIRGHNNDFVEGHNSILTSAELSYPILDEWNVSIKLPLIPQSLTSARIGIHINIFADAGTVFENGQSLILKKFYSGYGVGITLLLLPYNAFRFEYAINELGNGEIVFATGFSF